MVVSYSSRMELWCILLSQLLFFLENNVPGLLALSKRLAPNSADLNPVDFGIWKMLTKKVYKKNIRNLEHLQGNAVVVLKWDEILKIKWINY